MPEPRHDEVRAREPATVPEQLAVGSAAPAMAQRVLALQRSAGNAVVSRWLTASPQRAVARDGTPELGGPSARTR